MFTIYKGKRFLAIIPARSGSKGLKDKNIKELKGKPLIAYTIEAATKSGIFDTIIVSTDSQDYADIAKQYGAEVPFLRPEHLSTDTASSNDVIIHTIQELQKMNQQYDYFMLLQPTSPLRDEGDIIKACQLLIDKDANSVVSVCEAEHTPLGMNILDESLSMKDFIPKDLNRLRQQFPKHYRMNGAIYMCNVGLFLEYKDFYGDKSYAYIMDRLKSLDIDDELDFIFLECIINSYTKKQ